MSSYEKQMQWKKAASEKAKKNLEERQAEQESSFTPVFYTKSLVKESKAKEPPEKNQQSRSHNHRGSNHRSEQSGRSNAHSGNYDLRDSHDHAFYSPVGGGSVETAGSDPYSENSGVDDGGYGASYAEAHRREERRRHRDYYNDPRSHRRLEPATREDGGSATPSDSEGVRGGGGSADPASRREGKHSSRAAASSGQAERSERSRKERAGSRNQISHSLPHTGGSSNRSSGHNSGRRIRSISEGHSLSRTHSGSDSDSLGSASGDSPQEPIIELLERERRQWREEREQLIQCIHLQQLELSQRAAAAHERAADIAKEFARAIECFEERLVTVEGAVQKEVMGIKSVADALLHAASSLTLTAAAAAASTSGGGAGLGVGAGSMGAAGGLSPPVPGVTSPLLGHQHHHASLARLT